MFMVLLQASVFYAIVVGLPLGIAAAVVLLVRFRARVARSMGETAGEESARLTAGANMEISAPRLPAEAPYKGALVVDLVRPEEALAGVPAASRSAASAKRQAWRVALVYAVAASVLVLIMVNILRFVSPFNPSERVFLWHFLYFAAFFWVFATPAVLAAAYVIRKQVRYLVLAVLGLLAVVWLWDVFIFEGTLFPLWLLVGGAPAAVALLLATRRLRAVGPVVVVGTAGWTAISFVLIVAGVSYALDLGGFHFVRPDLQELSPLAALVKYGTELSQGPLEEMPDRLREFLRSAEGRIFTFEHPERENALRVLRYAIVLIAFVAGAAAAWAAVSWLASRHRRRRASDQMLTIDVMVLVFALFMIITQFLFFAAALEQGERSSRSNGNPAAIIFLSIIAFVAYKFVAAAGFRFVRKARSPEPPRTLLLLRVFGFARRSQRLFDDLGQRWRYLGPIRLIAGTDLAYATIEPHEFYDFLSGRLSRAFVKDQEDLESRLSKGAPVADPDGLFRIEDFYCHDDTWRMTIARLARDADAVFMDLRGFTASNCGCIYEIKLLVHLVPMDRVVLLIDKTTDVSLLERTLATTWQKIAPDSPNVTLERPAVRVLRASRNHWRTLNTLIAMLCTPADRAKIAPIPAPAS
jgi:hypothetical protein